MRDNVAHTQMLGSILKKRNETDSNFDINIILTYFIRTDNRETGCLQLSYTQKS